MNPRLANATALLARMLLALLFIVSGFGKITGFTATAGYMAAKGMPMAQVLLVGAIVIELIGGLLLVAGFKARWVALAIFLFVIPTTLIFHNPMGLAADAAQAQTIHFMKNLAIMGGLLMVVAFGPGAWSFDREPGKAA